MKVRLRGKDGFIMKTNGAQICVYDTLKTRSSSINSSSKTSSFLFDSALVVGVS